MATLLARKPETVRNLDGPQELGVFHYYQEVESTTGLMVPRVE
jgi:hypothetical protein